MRLILLTALTMTAFAANSLLNRMAVESGDIDPNTFALIRVVSGAFMLSSLVIFRGGGLRLFGKGRLTGALSLSLYLAGFSLAYLTLDAGLGALILFGTVQICMLGWTAVRGEGLTLRGGAGAMLAFLGLAILLWPGAGASVEATGAAFMVAAGVGWAIYTLSGRGATDPLENTASNFILAIPVLLIVLLGPGLIAGPFGVALAVLSGAVTSGLGYALWYGILPSLGAFRAAIVQLTVPVIAILAGVLFLGETVGLELLGSAVLVLGGIALALRKPAVPADRS